MRPSQPSLSQPLRAECTIVRRGIRNMAAGRRRFRDRSTTSTESHVRFDPYDVELIADPYPMFARLRDEAPLYYNAEYDFYALSRFADVNKAIVDHGTFSSARGAIMELIKANLDIPSGMLIFEDPPIHDVHRKLLSRMFTPRKIAALEPKIRDFCAQAWIRWWESGRFDFVDRPGRDHADEGHQRAARHSRGRSGSRPRSRQCPVAHRGRANR